MNYEVKTIVQEFETTYDGSPWLGNSLKAVLTGIEPAKAFEIPNAGFNSIASLVSHIIAWRMLLIKRMEGDDTYDVDQEESFNYHTYGTEPAEIWENLLNTLDENQNEIFNLLSSKQDCFLSEKVAKRTYNFRYLINGVIQHDIYHMGQIAILKK